MAGMLLTLCLCKIITKKQKRNLLITISVNVRDKNNWIQQHNKLNRRTLFCWRNKADVHKNYVAIVQQPEI